MKREKIEEIIKKNLEKMKGNKCKGREIEGSLLRYLKHLTVEVQRIGEKQKTQTLPCTFFYNPETGEISHFGIPHLQNLSLRYQILEGFLEEGKLKIEYK